MTPRPAARLLALVIAITALPAAGPVPSSGASDLVTLPGYAFEVRHSPGLEARTRTMADQVASVLAHMGPRLGVTPEVTLLVLAEANWADHTSFPLYGMPHILEGHTLIVAGEDNDMWRGFVPDSEALEASHPPEVVAAFRQVYGDGAGGLTGAPFFDLLAIHELGHAFSAQARVRTQRRWMGEFLPNLILHIWVEEQAPKLLPALTLLPDLALEAAPGAHPYTTLAQLEEHYVRIGMEHPDNYGWYQFRWHQGARRLHEIGGGETLDRLWAALRDTPEPLEDAAFLELLDTEVHPALGDLVRNWDAGTPNPPVETPNPPSGTRPLPVIDVHLHASMAASAGPPPLAMCTPFPVGQPWDPAMGPLVDLFIGMQKDPPCSDPVWSPETDEALMTETLEALERLNVYGVTSGPASLVRRWRDASPERIIPALILQVGPGQVPLDTLRAMHARGDLAVLGEVTTQYQGIHPADEALAPYWALAEELDIPVGIHVGTGPPGVAYMGFDGYRGALHSALTMEEVLLRHPRLRVYLMHAGYPLLDDLLTVLYAHPQVYVDVGVIVFTQPRPAFYRFLQGIVDAGYEKRILFGSDQMVWPGVIERSIAVIEEAPFLSEQQKRDILYNNAARFLRFSEEDIARHHRGGIQAQTPDG
ncbi:hypothetical protein BH23GEM11_BH23GEM11_16990 [soil metagenome]